MRQYTEADCMEQAGKPYTIHRKIVVLSGKAALMEKSGQLFLLSGRYWIGSAASVRTDRWNQFTDRSKRNCGSE